MALVDLKSLIIHIKSNIFVIVPDSKGINSLLTKYSLCNVYKETVESIWIKVRNNLDLDS